MRVARADANGEGVLAGVGVARDVAQVVDHQQRRGPETDGDARHDRERLHLFEQHVGGADGGDHAEEDEDEHLAEAEVAVGLRSAGVGPAGEDRERTDHEELRADDEREHATEHTCGCERDLRSAFTEAAGASPEPTRRSGPTRRSSSVPRTPSL